MKNNRANLIVATVVIAVVLMAVVEVWLKPTYMVKSGFKLVIFMGLPFVLAIIKKDIKLFDSLRVSDKRALLRSILLGVVVYGFILVCYYIFRGFIDLSAIASQLGDSLQVNGSNFIYVALYISLVNSLLEEFFFRGVAFIGLAKYVNKKIAYIFSAMIFSLYHVAILIGWFNIGIFLLIMTGLFVAGLFFNWLDDKNGTIYNSWLVHLAANLAINTVGLIMFSII